MSSSDQNAELKRKTSASWGINAAVALSIHFHFTQRVKDVWSQLKIKPLAQFQWLKRKDAITASSMEIKKHLGGFGTNVWFRTGVTGSSHTIYNQV